MQFVIDADHESLSRRAAGIIAAAIRAKPDMLLCAATGATPTLAYRRLVEMARGESLVLACLRLLKLDEWGGLAMDDPATCEAYLQQHLVGPLAVPPERYVAWDTMADSTAECQRIGRYLAEYGPIDLAVLGLGANLHLGFNEPGESLYPGPHIAQLSESSLAHPMLSVARQRPTCGLTLGMADLLRSREILLLVSGRHKAPQLAMFERQRISTHCPASFLHLHPRVTVLADVEAASLLEIPQ